MAEDYISMFDRGESKDDMELSYHCSSPAYSEEEGATQEDENTEQEQPGEGAEPRENFSVIVLTFAFF